MEGFTFCTRLISKISMTSFPTQSLLTILVCAIGVSTAFAQQLTITVKDKERQPLIGATAELVKIPDSTTLSGVTDFSGQVQFERLAAGLYNLTIRYIGYQPLEKSVSIRQGQQALEYVLKDEAVALGEVTVTAKRPLVRQEDDKTIVDPEPLANTSTSTLEVLEKTPGLFVDQDGGIFLNSATPATIFINGREQRMSARDIATILQSLPPGSVQRIEVLRTPSSKYDAASSGGIINIILKRGVRIGRTGSVNAGLNQGFYGNQFVGINLNDSGQKTAYYLNTNLSRNHTVDDIRSARLLNLDSTLFQNARSSLPAHQGYLGYGISYDPSEKWSLSYDGRINGSLRRTFADNFNFIENQEKLRLSANDNHLENRAGFFSLQQDLSLRWKIDSLGSEWDTKFSYNFNDGHNFQDYRSAYSAPRTFLLLGQGDNFQNRHFFLLQSDFTYRFPSKTRLETGFKSTFQRYESSAEYFFNVAGTLIPDAQRTNAFSYREHIHAAYLQASQPLPGNFLLKAGTRLEFTRMDGRQTIPVDTSFLIQRADWFPYVYLSRPIAKIAGYPLQGYLIYRRTIERPGYQSLNPYIRYVDQYLYETGNPALQPQFNDNVEFNISFDDNPIFAIGRNYTRDIFSNVVYQDAEAPEVAVRTFDNVGRNRETYFRLTGAVPPGGKYFFVVGAQYNLNEYDGLYEGKPLSLRRGSWRFFTFHSLNLTPTTKLTLNGFMMIGGLQNFYELQPFGQLGLGINQTFLQKKLSVNLNVRDLLRTMVVRYRIEQGGILIHGDRYSDNQRFGVNVRYAFGMKRKEERKGTMPLDEDGN